MSFQVDLDRKEKGEFVYKRKWGNEAMIACCDLMIDPLQQGWVMCIV